MNSFNGWTDAWVPVATYYLDPVNGNDSHAGTSPTLAWATYAKAEQQALTPGQSIAKKISGNWILFKSYSKIARSQMVMGYYQQFTPIPTSALDFSALTHISHDHVEPLASGALNFAANGLAMTAANSTALINAAHAAGVKVILSFADVFDTTGTAFINAVTNNLNTLVANIVETVVSRGYDGVDIDWEQGMTTAGVIALMTALYPAIKAANPNLHVDMCVSIQNPAGANIIQSWAAVANYTDTMNVMCYDEMSGGNLTVWHDAALFDGNFNGYYGNAMLSGLRIVRSFVFAGMPAGMLLFGIPFYGRLFSGNVGTPTSGPLTPRQFMTSATNLVNTYCAYGTPSISSSSSSVVIPATTQQVSAFYNAADDLWDAVAQVPYLSLLNGTPADNMYLTYDDSASVTAKVQWMLSKGLAGIAAWELTLDYYPSRSIVSPLLDAVKCACPKIALAAGATPSAPSTLTAQGVSTTAVPLEWSPVATATGYNVLRSSTSGSGYTILATVTGPSYTDASVTSGSTYYYVVAAINNGTIGANSSQLTVVASAGSPPAAPTALAASSVTPTTTVNVEQVTLTWSGSAASYLVKRSTMISGSCYVVIATTTSASYTDNSLAPGITYYYVVTAVVAGIESANSSQVTVTAPAYVPANLLTSPTDITNGAWSVSAGATAASATTITISSGQTLVSALQQVGIVVSPNVEYIATLTMIPTIGGWCTLSVYAPGWTPIPASLGQWCAAGVPSSFSVPFNTTTNPTVIFEFDCPAVMAGATVTVSGLGISIQLPGAQNLLGSPSAINAAPWSVAGTGASASGPSTLVCATTGVTSISQNVAIAPNTYYTATITLTSSAAAGYATLNLYAPGYASTIAHGALSLSTSAQTITVYFNSGSFGSLIFELDLDAASALDTLTVANLNLSLTPAWVQAW
jgi:GH18 family chitinase